MNRTLKLVLPLILVLSLPAAAQQAEEEAVSGRELLAGCEENAVPGEPNQYCMQYVFGLVQTVLMLQQMEGTGQQMFCIDPNAVSLQEVTSGVTNWLKAAGDRLDEDAYILVSEALHEQYPCNRV